MAHPSLLTGRIPMGQHVNVTNIRVRYGETDRMDTVYNSCVLDWFEVGRTEFMREMGTTYAEMEERGVCFPVVEATVKFLGRATYDDLLKMETRMSRPSRLRVRFEVHITHEDGSGDVASGHTVHALTNAEGKPIRPPKWFEDIFHAESKD